MGRFFFGIDPWNGGLTNLSATKQDMDNDQFSNANTIMIKRLNMYIPRLNIS